MNILLWHVHGAWTTAFVHGRHRYLIPVDDARSPNGRGRAQTYVWPDNAVEVTEEEAAEEQVDVVVLQRPRELDGLAERWMGGRRPSCDVPAVYVEHNAPQARIAEMRHPAADRDDLTVVHVTYFNDLFWDCGSTPTRVIEHGVPDPGIAYSGELPRCAAVINDADRRGRVTGTDLLPRLRNAAPIDLFGMGNERLEGIDLPQDRLHREMARRRIYLHPIRWTSLGLSLIEAMHMGMPVVALATTEVADAVPRAAGVVSNRVETLEQGVRELVADPDRAAECGREARQAARERFALGRFLADWDELLEEVA
jgi:glycosyltransferase involved in cell wall biosynthesis